MIYRKYHNEDLSIIGFGGIVVSGEEQRQANDFVAEALDQGINYFDVAPSYGNAEEKLGPALRGKRNQVFLACKTGKRNGPEAEQELCNSLKILETDCFDLYQLHGVTTEEEVNALLAPGGALEVLVKAKKEGKIRHIGFSAHTEEAACKLFDSFAFESVLTPINWASMLKGNDFGKYGFKIFQKAKERNAVVLALKALAKTAWEGDLPKEKRPYPKCWYRPIEDEAHAELAMRFTLSQPVAALIPPGDIRLFRLALKIAQGFGEAFIPINEAETKALMEYEAKEPMFPKGTI